MAGEVEVHRVHRNSPLLLREALHSTVSVKSHRGSSLTGGLLAVDPVSDTIVMVSGGVDDHQPSV